MISRPVAAAMSCRQCQRTIFKAVLTRPVASTSIHHLARQPSQLPILTRRFYSQQKSPETEAATAQDLLSKEKPKNAIESAENAGSASAGGDVPWFLEVEPPRHPPSQHAVALPKIPDDAPDFLEPMVKYIHEDMGLDDISLLDLRELDPPAALGPNLIMLFGTTRSERHLHVSSGRFVRWLKREHDISARADGLIGPGELRTKLRRLRKKAKLMGTNTAIVPGGDNGISTGWVCVNFGYHNGQSGETESFDESGRFSGFGASPTGTTVVVQCMTEARRAELSLETLWKGVMKKSLRDGKTVRGEKTVDKEELDALLATKVQLPTSPAASQWQAMEQASRQHRYFSTMARRLSPAASRSSGQNPLFAAVDMSKTKTASTPTEQVQVVQPSFNEVRDNVVNMQLIGTPITPESLLDLIKNIFQSPAPVDAAADRLSLTDKLLQTAEERGANIWNNELFVTIIESIATSPDYGLKLQRAQRNFEHLMISDGCQLDDVQVLRLMIAYEHQRDWARFWDTFKIPARFKRRRHIVHYEYAYRVMAESGSQKMCIEALRWVYPEMNAEQPPLYLTSKLFHSLKACIRVADPKATQLLHDPPETQGMRLIQRRRLANREFLKVLGEVERNQHFMSSQFAKDSSQDRGDV